MIFLCSSGIIYEYSRNKKNKNMAKINKKILIVEDDKDFSSILKIKFESEGFSVVTALDGDDGVVAAEKEKPDLIISDVLMPRMDGIQMAEKIKESNKDAVVVFLTNIKDVDYVEKNKKSAGFEYLIKAELRISEIVDKVKQKLGLT